MWTDARTVRLLALSTFTGAVTATALLRAEPAPYHSPKPQVAVLHEPMPVPVKPESRVQAPIAAPSAEHRPVAVDNPPALQVAGNPHRFVGSRVRWTCVIDQVPEPTFADAKCGPDVPSFVQPPLTGQQMQNEPDAVAASIRAAQLSLHSTMRALEKRALIVLTGPVANLDRGETIVIAGTVRSPLSGENAFGVTRAYPTVHVDTIYKSRGSVY